MSIIDGIFTQKSGSTGKEEGVGSRSCSGDKGFPSLPAVVCRAVGEDHPVSRGQGEPLRGQRLRAANQGASCEAL